MEKLLRGLKFRSFRPVCVTHPSV